MELREKDLDKLREDIDGVDESIMELFDKRMRISEEIARYKKENGLPVTISSASARRSTRCRTRRRTI